MLADLTDLHDALFAIFSLLLGLMVGSFLNVCVCRLPNEESVIKPRSRCPKCGTAIAWYDNLPVLSWVLLLAKCRQCKEPISWQYPLVEAITGGVFLLVFWRFGFCLASPIYMLLVAGLILCTFIDFVDWTIPNEVTYPGIPLGILCSLIALFYPASGLLLDSVFNSLMGVLVGGGSLYLLDKLSLLLLKKRGMGFGDVKLLAMLGAFLGWEGTVLIIVIASLLGSVIGILVLLIMKRKLGKEGDEDIEAGNYLPFGPYLAIGGVIVLLCGDAMIQAYFDYLNGLAAIG